MKKYLLIAAVAIMANAAIAQPFTKKEGTKVMNKAQRTRVQAVQEKKFTDVKLMQDVVSISKKAKKSIKKFDMNSVNAKDVKSLNRINQYTTPFRAASVQPEYTGYASVTGGESPWTMVAGTLEGGGNCLVDVIPNPTTLDGILAEYTQSGNTITINAQPVFKYGSYYVFICSYTHDDIIMELGEDGSLTLADADDEIWYYAFPTDTYDPTWATGLGYIEYAENIKYLLPGVTAAPNVEYQPSGLYLFYGLSSSSYGYKGTTFAMIPACSSVTLNNYTSDPADTFSWSISNGEETDTQTSNTRNFTFETGIDDYTAARLTGTYDGKTSAPYAWGVKGEYTNGYVFAGASQYSLGAFSDGTYPMMSLWNPANQLGITSTYSTSSTSPKSTLVFYQGKPDAPLYFEGISWLVSNFDITDKENFTLKCKIQKVTRGDDGWLTLGDVVAEADLVADNITVNPFQAPYDLTQLYWDNFYTLDEFGLGVSLDFISIEDEFAIVIDGWDNGTFTCQYAYQEASSNGNAILPNFYFAPDDEITDENIYMLGSKTRPIIGFEGAVYGYLYTEDDTNITLSADGSETSLHIKPLFTAEALWIDEDEEEASWTEWLKIGVANEVYEEEWGFDLVFSADALPAGTESREAEITFIQPGAKLTVKVTQSGNGGTDGITTVTKVTENGKAYNLSGRQVKAGQKGLIIRDGKKFIVK